MKNILFDMDGVLVDYRPNIRIDWLARSTGRRFEDVHFAIYESGIESAADAGRLSARDYLLALSKALGTPIEEAMWVEARRRATEVRSWAVDLLNGLPPNTGLAILINNGELLAKHWPTITPGLFPLFVDRALRRPPGSEVSDIQ